MAITPNVGISEKEYFGKPMKVSAVGSDYDLAYSSISWKSILAGFFISVLTYLIFASLGLALGASALTGIIQSGGDMEGLGIGSGVWMIVSTLVSLFIGSYVAGRIGGMMPVRIGRAQGAVIASLFFLFLLSQLGGAISLVGKGIGQSVSSLSSAVGDLSKNPRIQETVQAGLGDMNLKSPPSDVAQGLAGRLIRGDSTGARDYLANQAGISPAEAQTRLQGMTDNFQSTLTEVGATTAKTVSITGWSLFGALLLGLTAAVLGGAAGANVNLVRPLSASDHKAVEKSKAA